MTYLIVRCLRLITQDIENDYKKALDWALANREKKDIKNIALTGPYGSGKSSILKTYAANYPNNDLHFLNISLATFKEEEESPDGAPKEGLLRLIELSILQQIFYHEDDKRIPDSRFRKIKRYKRRNLFVTALSIFFVVVSVLLLAFPNLPSTLLNISFSENSIELTHYISFAILCIAAFIIIYKSIRILDGVKISKLNIQNAEIEIDKGVSKSILNHHIDEILYFFEVTEYNVVIIEDLDRFKQTEIFTKLREINLLINNSKKINKHVVFIYAVRDDMFREKNERTKFFDFIIPVIPIINPSNSGQKLLEKQVLYKYQISEDLIDSISLFIDDMRLLDNIFNEFYLYRQKLNKTLSQDKLLAIITYKNIFPYDFTLLSNNEGVLFNVINNKHTYINTRTSTINEQIKLLAEEINQLENLKLKDINELRYLYLLFYVTHLRAFISFNIKGDKTIVEMASDANFSHLMANTVKYRHRAYYSETVDSIPIEFSQVEKEVDNIQTYDQRKKRIEDWSNGRVEALRKQISQLENSKLQLRNSRIKELLELDHIEVQLTNSKQKNLVTVLLRNGFIDEDYLDYVSIFYEGSITKEDHQFLINVKSQLQSGHDYKLYKIERLIAKINQAEFDKEYTLNYYLVDFLLSNPRYQSLVESIFKKLKDESNVSLRFIDGFLDFSKNLTAFVSSLVSKWPNIWSFLTDKSNLTEERISLYFKYIIEYAEVADIKKLYSNQAFKEYLLHNKDFLIVSADLEKLKSIIRLLNVKFVDVNLDNAPSELVSFIYEGDFYEINEKMVKSVMRVIDQLNESDFETRNYFAVINSNCNNLKTYLQGNINEYIQNLYLTLENNTQEDQDSLILLINNEDLALENKAQLARKIDTVINDLSLIKDLESSRILLEHSRVSPTWQNVFYYYKTNADTISDPIVIFLESQNNSSELSKTKINRDIEGERTYTDFIVNLIKTDKLQDKAYESILKSVPYHFKSFDLNVLSKNKVDLMIQNGILTFNKPNFDSLKETYPDLHIKFVELNKAKFLKSISDFDLDENDVLKILSSRLITDEEKNKIIDSLNEDIVALNKNSTRIIGELILRNNSFRISDTLLKSVLLNNYLSTEQRIRIHNWKYNQLNNEFYNSFLNSLGDFYSEVTIRGKRPLLPSTQYNVKLADILVSIGYISTYSPDQRGIRLITFRGNNEQ